MSDQKEYVFYKNLKFFWEKKWVLLIVPIIISLIAAAFSLFSDREYIGKAVFYTSTIDKADLTVPAHMNEKYKVHNSDLEAVFSVLQSKRVQIKVVGDNQNDVSEELKQLSNVYLTDLEKEYQHRYDLTQETINEYQEKLDDSEKHLNKYYAAIEAVEDEVVPDTELLSALATKEQIIYEYLTKINRMETDLVFFEEPKLLDETITQSDNYLVQNTVISFVLSFFLTLLGLMLWRYIREARRAMND